MNALHTLKCRFEGCESPPAVIVEFEFNVAKGGCVCWPDRVQALCAQHWQRAGQLIGARVVYDYRPPTQEPP